MNAPQAWTELHAKLAAIAEHNSVEQYLSLYKRDEEIYRAGVSVSEAPKQLPAGTSYEYFNGGDYTKFVLRGSYAQLPAASQEAVRLVVQSGVPLRRDFNVERYINDPRVTPEDQLITEIMFPLASSNSASNSAS